MLRNSQRERITSRAILALALAHSDVKELKTFRHAANRLNVLREGLDVEVDKRDDVVSVSFDGPVAEDAPRIANAVVEAYQQYQSQPRHTTTADVLAMYQEQIARVQKDLDTTAAKMQDMEQHYGVLTAGEDSNSIANRRLTTLSQELTAAQFESLKAKSDYDEAKKSLAADAPGGASAAGEPLIVSTDQEETLRGEMVRLQSQLQELRQRYLPGHPGLRALERQIDQVNRSYAATIGRRFALAKARQEALRSAFDAQQKQLIDVSAKTAEYGRLAADSDRFRKSIGNIESRMQAIEVTREASSINIDFIEPASDAVRASPHYAGTLFMSLVLGLVTGVSAAFGREWIDDRLRSSEEIRAALDLPLLGIVPQMPSVLSATVAARKVALDPSSDVAEAYRGVRAAFDSMAPDDRCKTLVLAAPRSGEGTTTSAANLAIAMAQGGRRVLLVDGHLRDPMLHNVFGVRQHVGLSTVLGGQTSSVDKAIQSTGVSNLSVLPGGPPPRNSSDLLNSPAFPELLEQLAERYDLVIIDAPAVSDSADARIFAASCDLTVLVIRGDRATRRGTIVARDGLAGVGGHLLGVVVTHGSRGADAPAQAPYGYRRRARTNHGADEMSVDEDHLDIGASPA